MNNELVSKLARDAGFFAEPEVEKFHKFAELIVKECAKIAVNTDLGDVDGGDRAVLRAASEQIKKHFGVE